MRRYGALKGVMVITFITFMAGYLAIIGIPPFSGFWSKDEIIHAAFERNSIIGAAAILAAGITGFYMTRMVAMTFFGKKRWEDDVHPHESPKVMTIPLVILAIGSTFMGMALLFWGDIEYWLEPVVGYESVPTPLPTWVYIVVTLVVVIIGAIIGWVTYARKDVPIETPRGNVLTRAARQDLYGDAVNDVLVVEPTYKSAHALTTFDNKAVDGFVTWTVTFVGDLSKRLRRSQTGFARSYALSMVGGAIILLVALILVRLS
jgi:NADH:ubiquinone oxidoreductase subunit 5 (chain L)/Multisubunit Na+/H+ antiporter, MnhA subunit